MLPRARVQVACRNDYKSLNAGKQGGARVIIHLILLSVQASAQAVSQPSSPDYSPLIMWGSEPRSAGGSRHDGGACAMLGEKPRAATFVVRLAVSASSCSQ